MLDIENQSDDSDKTKEYFFDKALIVLETEKEMV